MCSAIPDTSHAPSRQILARLFPPTKPSDDDAAATPSAATATDEAAPAAPTTALLSSFTSAEVIDMFCRLFSNVFTISDEEQRPVGIGMQQQ